MITITILLLLLLLIIIMIMQVLANPLAVDGPVMWLAWTRSKSNIENHSQFSRFRPNSRPTSYFQGVNLLK